MEKKNTIKVVVAVVLLAAAGIIIASQMGLFDSKRPGGGTAVPDGATDPAAATTPGATSTGEVATPPIKKPRF